MSIYHGNIYKHIASMNSEQQFHLRKVSLHTFYCLTISVLPSEVTANIAINILHIVVNVIII